MSTKSQCAAIIATFKNRWFSTRMAFDHLQIMSLHRRLSDLEDMGYIVERIWHPTGEFKVYRITGKAA